MNLLRSICCLFGGRCAEKEASPTKETRRGEPSRDLGRKEAERETASEEQLRQMEGRPTSASGRGPQ
jgi:hypothetical protein